MRKLLLATVAALGASIAVSGYADAQIVDDTDGQAFPTPGTVTVRLNGRFRFYADTFELSPGKSTLAAAPASSASTGAATIATNTTNAGINKLTNYGFNDYVRLYPGFDGVAANGLKYGASIELRTDVNVPAGGGVFGSPSGQDGKDYPYVRREFGYLGTDRFGTLRLGASDAPTSLYLTGNFENFNDGGLDGDVPFFLPGNYTVSFPFGDQGALYTTIKAVYLSPQFYGVDFGLSFEPSTAAPGGDTSGCGAAAVGQFNAGGNSVAAAGCNDLSSTSTNDVQRRKDTYEALVRYRGTFGPIGIAATASYDGSGRVQDSGVIGSTTNPKHLALEDLSVGDFGLVLTYGGLSFGGNYQFGRYQTTSQSGFGGLIAKGQPNASAMIVGASYTIGPVIVGAHYLRSFNQGDQQTATNRTIFGAALPAGSVLGGQRFETGVGYGGTYSLAPGISIFLSGIWQERRQTGYNFITGASNNALNNKITSSIYAIGTSFAW